MSQPPVGVLPPQGYPDPKDSYPPAPGYPAQGYPPPQGYPQQGYPPPQQQQEQRRPGMIEGCLAALCCCCILGACF